MYDVDYCFLVFEVLMFWYLYLKKYGIGGSMNG